MYITLKKLNECQDAIGRVGALPISPEQPALSYRMSKNVESLAKNEDLKNFQREKLKLLQAFGKERTDVSGVYNLMGEGKNKYDEALDKLEAETSEIRIRTIDFKLYMDAIKPNAISPADINALEFLFTFPAEFDDDEDEKPTEKQNAKAIKAIPTAVPSEI